MGNPTTELQLPYGITHCYLPPDTSLNPSHKSGTLFTYQGGMEG